MNNSSRSMGLFTSSSNCWNGAVKMPIAVLADVAHVRDGLLFVLGGGVQHISYASFPGRLGRQVGIVLELRPVECAATHHIKAIVQDVDGNVLVERAIQLQVSVTADLDPGEPLLNMSVFDLMDVEIPAPGRYSVEIIVNGKLGASLPFKALLIPAE